MADETIITGSKIGQHLNRIADSEAVSYLTVNRKRIQLAATISIGRDPDANAVVIDNKLASRRHAVIQKIKDAYFIKDAGSTNGTFVNGQRIPPEKWVRLGSGDKITIGTDNLVLS